MKSILFYFISLLIIIKGYYIYDISLEQEYEVDLGRFDDYFIPSLTNQYFKLRIDNEKKIEFQLKVFRGAIEKFKITVCGYEGNPTQKELIKGNANCYNDIGLLSISKYDIYDIYKYHFEKFENAKYILINVYNIYSLDYLSVYAYNYKEDIKYTIYDVTYMKELKLEKDTLKKHEGIFLFRLKNDNGNVESIKLKVRKEISPKIIINAAGYMDQPNTTDDFDNYLKSFEPKLKSINQEENYSIYEYVYEKIEDSGYICVAVTIDEKLEYLSFYIGI